MQLQLAYIYTVVVSCNNYKTGFETEVMEKLSISVLQCTCNSKPFHITGRLETVPPQTASPILHPTTSSIMVLSSTDLLTELVVVPVLFVVSLVGNVIMAVVIILLVRRLQCTFNGRK